VLEFSLAGFRHETIAASDTSLVIRCRPAALARTLDRTVAGQGRLRAVRIESAARSEITIRLSYRGPSAAKVFRVEAGSGRPPRLVVDLQALEPPIAAPEDADTSGGEAEPAGAVRAEPAPPAARSPSPEPTGMHVVVLDAGHGGKDPGATAKGLREKEVCLDVAARTAGILNGTPGFRAHLTRADDRFIPLGERMRVAERKDADLFVSIHVNAAKNRQASGAEVFFLSIGAASDRASSELARLENEADPDYVVAEDEELRGLPFAVDLRQSDTMLRSSRIAEVVLDLLAARRLAEPRGVRQAGFAVLKSFQVTSILVEVGFISSPADRKKLQTKEHRVRLAEALAAGIREYFEKYAPQRAGGGASGAGGR
jgi:N-acetylmuramoyl-L-alanine amidase